MLTKTKLTLLIFLIFVIKSNYGQTLTEIIKDMPEKVIEMMKEKVYLKRMGEPEDIANAFLFLASDMGKYVNSTVLSVDGGVVV